MVLVTNKTILDSQVYFSHNLKKYNVVYHISFVDFEASSMAADPIPFRSVLLLSPRGPVHPDYEYFQDLVLNYSSLDPFNIPFHPYIKVGVSDSL